MMNSGTITDRSIAFALRLEREHGTLDRQVCGAFRLALGREPGAEELQRMRAYVGRMRAYHRDVEPPRLEYPTRITRSLVQEFSGKVFEYDEILPAFEDYVADRKAAEVSGNTRALADFCLLLLNCNEFMYVY